MLSHAGWYLGEFDRALEICSGSDAPQGAAQQCGEVVDLWEAGEKVLVFAFYRYTCRLPTNPHQPGDRAANHGRPRGDVCADAGQSADGQKLDRLLETVQRRFFDDTDSPGRRAVDAALRAIMDTRSADVGRADLPADQVEALQDVMRRFLRVTTTLARCFPLGGTRRVGAGRSRCAEC